MSEKYQRKKTSGKDWKIAGEYAGTWNELIISRYGLKNDAITINWEVQQ